MGRRKIEIEPITHERNRSVTFLKRKNGLFKKAYELGVLCSVDVAVIIFEERPGHHVKLYQYCSGNVEEIIQRHAKFDGERDTRSPNDFTNGSDSKLDDILEGDDDDAQEDEPEPILMRGAMGTRKSGDVKTKVDVGGKVKQSASKSVVPSPDVDPLAHRPMTIPNPPMPISSGSFPIPAPGESSKARLGHPMGLVHPLQEDMNSGYGYHPSSAPPSYRGPHYPSYFPVSSSPPPFMPGSPYDYHPRSHYRHMNYPPSRSIPPYHQHPDPYMRLTAQQYHHHQQQHGYPPMMYPPPPPPPQQSQHPGDMFAAFLDGDPRQHGGPTFGPMEWPAHAPVQDGRPEQGDPNDTSWLDFLSNNPPLSNLSMQVSPSQLVGGSEMISRERHQPLGNGTMAISSRPTSSNEGALGSPKRKSSKRPRIDSGDKGLDRDVAGDVEMMTPTSARNGTNMMKIEVETESGDQCDEE